MVGGGCTWSNVKACFFPEDAEDGAAAAGLEPTEEGAEDVASIVTVVEDMALMTVLWKRAGMEVESWLVGGRIRSAVGRLFSTPTGLVDKHVLRGLTHLDRGRRTTRRRRRRHGELLIQKDVGRNPQRP